MTKDEALKMAIEQLEADVFPPLNKAYVIAKLKEALEQPTEQQKAFMDEVKYGQSFMIDENHVPIDSFNK